MEVPYKGYRDTTSVLVGGRGLDPDRVRQLFIFFHYPLKMFYETKAIEQQLLKPVFLFVE
jgi:hypothetical protein